VSGNEPGTLRLPCASVEPAFDPASSRKDVCFQPDRHALRPVKVNELSILEVEDLALGGKALARLEGRIVFADQGLPGDRLTARITRVQRRFAEARVTEVEARCPQRVEAPCAHVHQCGGCRFQDLDYAAQLALKERQTRQTLRHLGGFADPPVRGIVGAPAAFGYRNKMEFSFHPAEDGRPLLGLHERGTFDRVFEVERCHLTTDLAVRCLHATQAFAREHGWRAYHPARRQGVVRFLSLRHLESTGQAAVSLVAASDEIPGLEEWARAMAALDPAVRTVMLGLNRSRANVALAEEERVLWGEGFIVERLLGLDFEVRANAFLQTNSRQAERLYAAALDAAEIAPGDEVLDLYSGTGTLTLLAARRARAAVGVESVAEAVACAERNARRNGVVNARVAQGEARAVLREWAQGRRSGAPRPAAVIVDPPRAGLHPRVVQRVAELEPPRVVYVSCNPATLARDLRDFARLGYALEWVTPFDMFPHTPHIECVARLSRAGAPG
jgi:23S rRNA (uracil1939-C5)-methyltransferase